MPQIDFVCIYRKRNRARVSKMLGVLPTNARVALWALDEIDAELNAKTIGNGAGQRPELINRLVASFRYEDGRWLIMSDDDVVIRAKQFTLWLRLAVFTGLDLSQPSHLPISRTSWNIGRQRISTFVRIGRWVEQGPLVAFSPRARGTCFPLREDFGMGWGLELGWAALPDKGFRLGIVDAVGMRHYGRVAVDYDRRAQYVFLEKAQAEYGYENIADAQLELNRWSIWQSQPPWNPGLLT